MLNSYAYNRKMPEEDQTILAAVQKHHKLVTNKGHLVVMTSLVGSQNYDLDDKNSDIDTFSFVFPSLKDLAMAKEPYTGMFETEDGHCEIKDIRLACNLLRKASPNSVEYFTSKYKVYNPIFADILQDYLDNNNKLWHMIHCNYEHMITSIAGMGYQMTKRNMSAGRRFSHLLRLDDMWYHFTHSFNAQAVIEMRPGGNRDLAILAKRDKDSTHDIDYQIQCETISNKLDTIKDNFKINPEYEKIQRTGLVLIDSFQLKLFKQYLTETNKDGK